MAKDNSLVIALIGIIVLAVAIAGVFHVNPGAAASTSKTTYNTPCKTFTSEDSGKWNVAWSCTGSDIAKCSSKDMCVYQGICYANRYKGVFPRKTADIYAICAGDQANKWFDVDGGQSQCLELNQRFPGLTKWAIAGEPTIGEYYNDANGGGLFPYECCGDDAGEYPIATGYNNTLYVCCNDKTDIAVLENGVWVCKVPFCGDGKINVAGEVCDDGNNIDGDGCSNTCGCSETDGGNNIYVKGVLTGPKLNTGENPSDYCVLYDSSTYPSLVEYNCVGSGTNGGASVTCPYGCFNDRCLDKAYTVTCRDSDGYNKFVKGTARSSIRETGEYTEMQDKCQDNNVIEYSCRANGFILSQVNVCTSGCADGRCLNVCGNSVVEPPEECDGAVPNGVTCASKGFAGGNLTCSQCKLDTSGCVPYKCIKIDNILQPGEQCDGSIYHALTCGKFGFTQSVGSLSCGSSCMINTNYCVGPTGGWCGDNIVTIGEQCDGSVYNMTCADFGFAGGTLICNPSTCKIDTSRCIVRDNVTISVSALLDGAEWRGPVIFDLSSRADFNGFFASGLYQVPKIFSYPPPNNPIVTYIQYRQMAGYQSGPEGAYLDTIQSSCGQTGNPRAGPCNAPTSFVFKFKTASFCGDNLIQQPNGAGFNEQCDGTNLGGHRCSDFNGYTAGTLSCLGDCTFDFSGCTTEQCIDSDGGQNYYVKGSISGAMPPGYIPEDRCVADMNGTLNRLREVVCIDNFGSSVLFDCPYGCNDGYCWTSHSPCSDSDGGQIFGIKGYVTYEGYTDYTTGELIKEWDACSGNVLNEKYCSVSGTSYGIGLIGHTCPNGCSDGACI